MNPLNENRHLERQQFFNGQRLFASDLQELEAFNRQMRWLHNRSLHQPGIGNGFAVVGKKGDREVIVRPGYAIDGDGCEIVLTQTHIEPVPPVASDAGRPVLYDLTVSYPDDARLEEVEARQGICGSSGVVRLREEPVFCWVRLNENGQPDNLQSQADIRAYRKIVLARAEVLNCQLNKDLSVAERLNARPSKQPYICCGTAQSPNLKWNVSTGKFDALGSQLGQMAQTMIAPPIILPIVFQAAIDTTECNFLTEPCYSVRIDGDRVGSFAIPTGQQVNFLLDHKSQISMKKQNGFTITAYPVFQLLISLSQENTGFEEVLDARALAGTLAFSNEELAKVLNTPDTNKILLSTIRGMVEKSSVVWMGVEG